MCPWTVNDQERHCREECAQEVARRNGRREYFPCMESGRALYCVWVWTVNFRQLQTFKFYAQ